MMPIRLLFIYFLLNKSKKYLNKPPDLFVFQVLISVSASQFSCLGNSRLKVVEKTMLVNNKIFLGKNLSELLTPKKYFKVFFTSIYNITIGYRFEEFI